MLNIIHAVKLILKLYNVSANSQSYLKQLHKFKCIYILTLGSCSRIWCGEI